MYGYISGRMSQLNAEGTDGVQKSPVKIKKNLECNAEVGLLEITA